MTGSTRVLGVMGNPVAHSVSPAMHNAAIESMGLNYVYVPFHVEHENVKGAVEAIRALGIVGMNVTVPHKEAVIEHLDEVSVEARAIGSVNTITNDDGVLRGTSTDGPGFIRSIRELGVNPEGLNVVVAGAGGVAKATVYALAACGAKVKVLNRTLKRAISLAKSVNVALGSESVVAGELEAGYVRESLKGAKLFVNCTSVGMHPKPDAMPIPADALHPGLLVYDQVYNPGQTLLLKAAKEVGAGTVGGLRMLVYQGAVSFQTWTGLEPPVDIMEEVALKALEFFRQGS